MNNLISFLGSLLTRATQRELMALALRAINGSETTPILNDIYQKIDSGYILQKDGCYHTHNESLESDITPVNIDTLLVEIATSYNYL